MNFINKLRSSYDKFKIIIIYILLYIVTILVGNKIDYDYTSITENAYIILIINTILFILLIKLFNVKFKVVKSFIIGIMICFFICIIDRGYFLSGFQESMIDNSIIPFITYPLNIILLPFVGIFDWLYAIGMFNLSIIIIPIYFLILLFILKKIVKAN